MTKKIKNRDLAQSKHIEILKALQKQAVLGFSFVMKKMLENIKTVLKKEKLIKSDKLPTGWTGEVPTITINFDDILAKTINKYIKSLEWIMLGGYASKEATEAAKELGLTKIMVPGVAPSAYLNAIDAHREHYKDLFGKEAPDIPNNIIKIAFDQIKNRCVRVTEEFGVKLKNRIFDSIDQVIKEKNMNNIAEAHSEAIDSLHIDGADKAISDAIKDLDEKLSVRKITKAFKEAESKLAKDWELIVGKESALSSAVATHQSMIEIYGENNDDVTVIIEGFYDDRICDWCLKVSKKEDGSFKKYKMKDFKPSGYNFNRKKSDWELCIAPFHYNCFSDDTEVLTNEGWKKWPIVNGSELFLSIDPNTQNAEWVRPKKLIIQKYHGDMIYIKNKYIDLLTTPNHNHVFVKDHKNNNNITKGIVINQLSDIKDYSDFSFLITIPNWNGICQENITIGEKTFNTLNFIKFLGIYLSLGSIIYKNGSYEIKINHVEHCNNILETIKLNFDNFLIVGNAAYINLKNMIEFGIWINSLKGLKERYIPNNIKNLSKPYLEELLKYYGLGSQFLVKNNAQKVHKAKPLFEKYFVLSKRLASDIDEILLKCGHKPVYYKNQTSDEPLIIIKGKNKKVCLSNVSISNVHYNGFVYDVELEKHHTLIVKRNNNIVVSGNCRCQLIYVPRGFDVDNQGNFIPKK